MNTSAQNLAGLFAGIWPRIAGFSSTPSLLVIALLANLIAVIPTAFRVQKDTLACEPRLTACAESAPARTLSD